ncbi:MAG: cyclodeaminase/cyclohydrolase family protein [Planctomycetes bacterium]|nr:cyclodeaminase/cyclohydrolase family protein [Planctomycetota bacterium]
MASFTESTIQDYINVAKSDAPTPGGGSVSALCGALASCMATMAANFTVGKKKFAEVEDEVKGIIDAIEPNRVEMLKCMDDDAIAFAGIGEAYKMQKETDDEKAARREAIQKALKNSMAVPMRAMRAGVNILERLPRLAEIGNPNLVSDTGVAALIIESAVKAAYLNVLINVTSIKDEAIVTSTRTETADLLAKAAELNSATQKIVESTITG